MKTKHLLLIISLFFANHIFAQDIQSSTSGFSVYGGASISGWSSESFFLSDLAESEPGGFGFKLGLGYGFNEKFSVHLQHYNSTFKKVFDWDTFSFSSETLSARFTFGATLSKWRPYIEAGLATARNKVDPITIDNAGSFELRNTGFGIHTGGGLNFHINSSLAISAQANYLFGSFSDITISGEIYDPEENVDFGILHINFGIRYYID